MLQATPAVNIWQFPTEFYQQVVYECILHNHRRDLHRKAAHAFMSSLKSHLDAASHEHSDKTVSMGQQAAHHFMKVFSSDVTGTEQEASSWLQDVTEATAFVGRLSRQLIDQGYHSEGFDLQMELCDSVLAKKHHTSSAVVSEAIIGILEDTLRLLIKLKTGSSCVTNISQFKVNYRLKKMMAMFDEQASAVSKVDTRKSHVKQSGRYTRALKSMSSRLLMQSPQYLQKAAPVYCLADSALYGSVSEATCTKISAWYNMDAQLDSRFISAAAACVLGIYAKEWPVVASIAKEASFHVSDGDIHPSFQLITGVPLQCTVALAKVMSFLMCGNIDASENLDELDATLKTIPESEQAGPIAMMRAIEGSWEPQCSRRVRRWAERQNARSTGHIPLEWIPVESYQRHLNTAYRHADLLRMHLHSSDGCKASCAADSLKDSQTSWHAETLQAISEAKKVPWVGGLLGIARNCIYQGCQVIFPHAVKMMGYSQFEATHLGMSHLEAATSCLQQCLNEYRHAAGTSASPGVALYIQAMLGWFQWCLNETGYQQEDRPRSPGSGTGLSDVCSMLLQAQVAAMASKTAPQLLTACLPATVSLARLLRGDALLMCSPVGCTNTNRAISSFIPIHASISNVQAQPDLDCLMAISVKRVIFGSNEAASIAANHLTEILRSINSGRIIQSEQLQSVESLFHSETIWEAAALLHDLRARTTSISSRDNSLM